MRISINFGTIWLGQLMYVVFKLSNNIVESHVNLVYLHVYRLGLSSPESIRNLTCRCFVFCMG